MTEPVAEAYELVEHGVITERDFRDLTFVNPVRLHAGPEPRLLRRARSARPRRPPTRWRRRAREPRRRPAAAIGGVRARRRRRRARRRPRASGADSMVVDLEEPQTPYPEPERERGRKVAREFFDSLVPGELPLRVRAGAAAVDRPDAEGPAGGRGARAWPASCCPRSRPRPTCTRSTRCSPAWRSTTSSSGAARHLPDPRDRAGDPAGVRDRDRVAARRAHGRRAVALRRHPPGPRLPLDRGGGGDALPALEGAGRRQGRRDPLPDQRHVGRRARRPRRPAHLRHRRCATSATTG